MLALVLFVVAFLIGAVYLGRIGVRLDRAVERGDPLGSEVRGLLGRWMMGSRLVILLLLAITWDMVFKPGL